jgi:hypothetical protein
MGINDEYSRDAYIYELAYDSEDSDNENDPLHPEDWQDWYSEEILDAWVRIREYTESNYIELNTTYPRFVEFIMYPTRVPPQDTPTSTENDLWNLISRMDIIQQRVESVHFYGWIRQNIDRYCNV